MRGPRCKVALPICKPLLARAQTPQDKGRVQRRIDALQPRSDQHTAAVDAAAERQARLDAPEVQAALTEAQELLDLYRFRPDVAQDVVEGAENCARGAENKILTCLPSRPPVASLKGKHNQARQATMAQLRANIKTLEGELLTVKVDAAPPEAAAPQTGGRRMTSFNCPVCGTSTPQTATRKSIVAMMRRNATLCELEWQQRVEARFGQAERLAFQLAGAVRKMGPMSFLKSILSCIT